MKHSEVVKEIERLAPIAWQEPWDNCGFQVGSPHDECQGVLIALDPSLEVLTEAVESGVNLVICHHPLMYKPPKTITGRSQQEKVIMEAIRVGITIYAAHTNIDKYPRGVSYLLGKKMGLNNLSILIPSKNDFRKLVFYVPHLAKENLCMALYEAGAGLFGGYSCCSFTNTGEGSFLPMEGSNPYVGSVGEIHHEPEERVEMIFPSHLTSQIEITLRKNHPYETPAYQISEMVNVIGSNGLGMIGELNSEMSEELFLSSVVKNLELKGAKHSALMGRSLKKVALCGGSGESFIKDAIAQGADVYITGEIGYHTFDNYKKEILLMEIGHFESERYIKELIYSVIREKFTTFAVRIFSEQSSECYFKSLL